MIPETCIGELSVLNCGEGDIRVSLDTNNPVDVARAERIITDMLKRGYMLFVDEGDGKLKRAVGFDSTKKEYLIVDGPGPQGSAYQTPVFNKPEGTTDADVNQEEAKAIGTQQAATGKGKKGRPRGIPLSKARATGVPRTAGG